MHAIGFNVPEIQFVEMSSDTNYRYVLAKVIFVVLTNTVTCRQHHDDDFW
jgi:hypothetical protein